MIQVCADPAYPRLKEHLIASTGLAFYADRDELLGAAIGARLSDLGLSGCSSYSRLLADGGKGRGEMDVLIDKLTIGETYFFRDTGMFTALREVVLPDILSRKQSSKELRIWSAGCATGAEPYSLAILLQREMADRIAGWRVEIHASDMNRGFLTRAAEGKFRPAALRSTPDAVKRECFSNDGGIWTIHPRYKQWVSFHLLNLVEGGSIAGLQFDLILCRNVMIYFAPEIIRRLIGQLHESLNDGGWLAVGSSEYSLDGYQTFRTVNAVGARLFRKEAILSRQTEFSPELQPAIGFAAPVPAAAKAAVETGAEDLEGLRRLADSGDWQGASEYGQRLLTRDRLNPAVHFCQALIFENLGIAGESERSLRQAIYLDRKFALAHYHLGLSLKKHGETRAAARSFGNVLKVLAGTADQAPVAGSPGLTATRLKDLARMHMAGSNEA